MEREVLDIYDDRGALLTQRGLGSQVAMLAKQASDPTSCPDDLFALRLGGGNGAPILRKFACNDRANTALSVLYFRETPGRLPADLRKVAARRLVKACGWYGFKPPSDLLKAADLTGTSLTPNSPKPAADDKAKRELELGVKAIQVSPETQRKQAELRKTAMQSATAERYADPENHRYPLASITDVTEANRYMDKYASEMDPRTRRRVAFEIRKRAAELHLPVSKAVRDLTCVKIASADTIRGHLRVRQEEYGTASEAARMIELLMPKVASLRPSVLAETIAQIDEAYGGHLDWGRTMPDPWSVVFEKRAEDSNPANYSYDLGTRHISGVDLVRLAKMGLHSVKCAFGEDFAREFAADPIGFFSHLPTPEKKSIANMAHDTYSPPVAAVFKAKT